eukprot:g2173.t1
MKALAESDGSRLPRNHEVQAFVDGAPVRGCEGVDAWTPTTGWDGQDHTWPDWVQIGSGPHHHPGKGHVHDCGGYPAWGAEEAQRPWQRMLLVVRGDQDAAGAEVLRPSGGIALSPDGKRLFFADVSCKIRVVNLADGAVSTLAGSGIRQSEDGVGLGASFAEAKGLALSPDGKQLFVADWGGNKIRVVNVADGTVTTLAGSGEGKSEDGVSTAASFSRPIGLALSSDGDQLFVADFSGRKIRVVNVADGTVSTLAGSGEYESEVAAASFIGPHALALSPDSKQLFVADFGNHTIRVVNVADGTVTTLAGSGKRGSEDGVGATASFSLPTGLATSPDGKQLFVAEEDKIRAVNIADASVTTLAGSSQWGCNKDAVGAAATFNKPACLVVSPDGSRLFVGVAHKIRAVQLTPIDPVPLIVIPPSTLLDDFKKMTSDPDMPDMPPQGLVTFIVGPERKRFEHLGRNFLCVRSEYFDHMFRNAMAEGRAVTAATVGGAGAATAEPEIEVPDTDPASFQTLLDYIATDQAAFPGGPQHAFWTMQLARKHGMVRLERLCLQALEGEYLTAETAVPMLEAARAVGGGCEAGGGHWLFHRCRRFIQDHSKEVVEAGGLEQLQEHAVTKGLL